MGLWICSWFYSFWQLVSTGTVRGLTHLAPLWGKGAFTPSFLMWENFGLTGNSPGIQQSILLLPLSTHVRLTLIHLNLTFHYNRLPLRRLMVCWDKVWLGSTLALPSLSQLRGLCRVPHPMVEVQGRAVLQEAAVCTLGTMEWGQDGFSPWGKQTFEFTRPKSHAKWANYQLKQVKAMLENMIGKHFFFYFHAAAEIIYCCCCCSLCMALQFWHNHVIGPWFVCGCFCFVDLSHYWGEAIRDWHTPVRGARLNFMCKAHLCKPSCIYMCLYVFSWHRVLTFHPFVFWLLP